MVARCGVWFPVFLHLRTISGVWSLPSLKPHPFAYPRSFSLSFIVPLCAGRTGFEPATNGFGDHDSSTELPTYDFSLATHPDIKALPAKAKALGGRALISPVLSQESFKACCPSSLRNHFVKRSHSSYS